MATFSPRRSVKSGLTTATGMPPICWFYGSAGNCKRGTACRFVHQQPSETYATSPTFPYARAQCPYCSRKACNEDCARGFFVRVQTAAAELEEEQAYRDVERKTGEVESRVDQAVHARKVAELEAKDAKNKMNLAVKAQIAAETRAKEAEARADDATKARKELELAARTAAQRELQAIEEARNAKRAQAEAEERLNRYRCRATDEHLRSKGLQNAAKEHAVTMQRIVSGSIMATFGPGLDVQSTICDFDNGLIEYESSSIIATVAVGEDTKMQVARAITGRTIRNQTVTAKPLKAVVGCTLPRHYNLNISWENREKSAPRKCDFCNALKQRLVSAPGITSFTVSSGLKNDSRGTATACFDSETSADQARNSVRGLASTFLTVTIRCNLASMKYALAVPLEQYYLHETRKSIRKYGEMSAASMMEGLIMRVKSLGYDWFNGWQWFDDANAKVFFGEDLRRQVPSIMMIRWDCMTKTLVIYADSETGIQQASTHIDLFASQSEQSVFCDRIDRPSVQSLICDEQVEALNEEFGEDNVSVDVLRSQYVVAYHGGRSLFPARQLLEEIESEEHDAEDSVAKSSAHCSICLCRVSASRSRPVTLICGHEYCIPCLKKRLLAALGQQSLPFTCFGDGDRCQRPIAIPIIQSLLSPIEFEGLVERVVEIHLAKHGSI
ncbi:hypothetical protein M378DRAFT_175689 [Amanita muscaria Koide BX008]|uniref:Uncharacterized protein n=1 Tax=Amanita muscaria (strain Koide BX008) TaxID=946122 RepID=A0A0C2XN12_AMAMK|nr:hypothetical protein M378DRAFT_175689 [Amanita muscaria Koide BX008]